MQKHLAAITLMLVAACVAMVGATEYEINLVRNPEFLPGMDRQGPKDWAPYYLPGGRTNICEAGRGDATFTEDGLILGQGYLFQLGDMFDDISPAYKLSCRMKTEGAEGAGVLIRFRGDRSVLLKNTELGVWEDLDMDVTPDGHYGFTPVISVPEGSKLHIRRVKVTAVLEPSEDGGGQVLISDNSKDVPVRGIRLPAEPNWFEQLAAHELRVNIYLISGAVLPVFAGVSTSDEKGYIRIASLKKMIPDVPVPREQVIALKEPEANGFRVICRDGQVELTGGNDAGVLAGAMHLSELLGAKFYAPRVHTITTNRMLKIPAMEIIKHPAFEWTSGPASQKQTLMGWKYGYLHSDSCIAPCDKASPPTAGWGHPPLFLAPPYLYAESHPEYYALAKGKRVVDGSNKQLEQSWGYLNLCLGNPELQQVIAERIGHLMDLYPQCKYFSIAQGDGQSWCECDLCKALDVDNEILTDRMIAYANSVATLLESRHPDRKLVILAYGKGREDLPLREKLHPNVAVHYAFWPSSWPIWEATVCEQNKRGLKLLDDWNALTGTNLTIFMYPVNTYENAEKLKLFAEKGIKGFHQCGVRGDFPEIMIYTSGRLIWNPDVDVEKMIDEIMPHIYGEAAPFMRRYFDTHHHFICELVADPVKYRIYFDSIWHRIRRLPLDYAAGVLDVINKAEAAAGNNVYALDKIRTEKYQILYAYANEFQAVYPEIPGSLFSDYAGKMTELVKLARKRRERGAVGFRGSFSEWLYQTTGGALDFDRTASKWFSDPKVETFLADPVKVLKTRVYFQEKITSGWKLPQKALLGGQHLEKYAGRPAVTIRRKSSPVSRVRAYFLLDTLPENEVELQVQGLQYTVKPEVSIKINNHEIFAGLTDFPENTWGWHEYKVPREYFKQGENIIVIENTTGDYKKDVAGQAGPAEEALAKNYRWGWCMISSIKLMGIP